MRARNSGAAGKAASAAWGSVTVLRKVSHFGVRLVWGARVTVAHGGFGHFDRGHRVYYYARLPGAAPQSVPPRFIEVGREPQGPEAFWGTGFACIGLGLVLILVFH